MKRWIATPQLLFALKQLIAETDDLLPDLPDELAA
jgi:hypothetical protein